MDRLPHYADRLHRIAIVTNIKVFPIERQEARQQYNWAQDALVIAFFGFLHPVKGIEYLLAAFAQVVVQYPQARLLLVGGVESLALPQAEATKYWDKLRSLIAQLEIAEQVVMTGYVDAKTASHYLSSADIGVLPFNHGVTLKSGSLLALLAHGLPVIATHSTGGDLLTEDFLAQIPTRDVEALTAALLNLINDPQKRDRLGDLGRKFSDRFTWSFIGEQHRDIYQQLLS